MRAPNDPIDIRKGQRKTWWWHKKNGRKGDEREKKRRKAPSERNMREDTAVSRGSIEFKSSRELDPRHNDVWCCWCPLLWTRATWTPLSLILSVSLYSPLIWISRITSWDDVLRQYFLLDQNVWRMASSSSHELTWLNLNITWEVCMCRCSFSELRSDDDDSSIFLFILFLLFSYPQWISASSRIFFPPIPTMSSISLVHASPPPLFVPLLIPPFSPFILKPWFSMCLLLPLFSSSSPSSFSILFIHGFILVLPSLLMMIIIISS